MARRRRFPAARTERSQKCYAGAGDAPGIGGPLWPQRITRTNCGLPDCWRRRPTRTNWKREQACKPGSVVCGHLSWVAGYPAPLAVYPGIGGPPHLPLRDLAPGGVYRAGRSPGRWCALTAPLHPYPGRKHRGGLSLWHSPRGRPHWAFTQHPALRSPDFPRARGRPRPPSLLPLHPITSWPLVRVQPAIVPGTAGSVNRTIVPPSGGLSAAMAPPCASTRLFAMARPNPAPRESGPL